MLRLIFTFYYRFIVAASLLSIAIMLSPMPFGILLFCKLALSALTIAIVQLSYPNETYYYRNLGVRPITLWIGSFVIDVSIFCIVAIPLRLFL